MRFHGLIVAALAIGAGSHFLPSTEAFTNGVYLPSYICGPAVANATSGVITGADGMPKALGGVLAKMIELTPGHITTYNATVDPRLWVGVMHAANTQNQLNAFKVIGDQGSNAFVEAALGTPAAMMNGGIITAAQVNILHVGKQLVVPTPADLTAQGQVFNGGAPLPAENIVPAASLATPQATTITPNQVVTLTLQSQNNVLGVLKGQAALNFTAFANVAKNPAVLDGAVVYAQDVNNNRVGHFTAAGPNMAIWNACGPDRNGVVQTQLLSPNTNTYTGPQFFLPFDFTWKVKNGKLVSTPTTITFMGAAVSDNGFGYHQTPWQVTPLADFTIPANMNPIDFTACLINNFITATTPACFASCLDCAVKGGSTAKLTCAPVPGTGNPAAGQAFVWNATCMAKGKTIAVVPAGTLAVEGPMAKDATGNEIPLPADQQALMDQMNTQLVAAVTDPQNNVPMPCPATNTQTNNVNTATTTHMNWFSTFTVALCAWLTSRQ